MQTFFLEQMEGNLKNAFLVLSGPNLNLLGKREPQHYGNLSLDEIHFQLLQIAQSEGVVLDCFQSNVEGELIGRIHQCWDENTRGIVFNPAAFTHTSIALRDALLAVKIPFVEVHLSNIYKREVFRQKSYFSDIAEGSICGLGAQSYDFALRYLIMKFKK